ncbi:uncharacterized protein CIMG_01787 [Coccidioides immitis RS]|uniref:Oxidoreductase-like protein n=2 Tax=Coccidioides immitis TaxID=5501 RepID=J3KJX8_COCIM|nr:uncharacterized protein CIMG_01787 [Coccidioides immitis RS]EAS36433.3 hypothetical protein CIMG_01787 [Coccidioides immitis RS]KMP01791.1 hypothetical protein CIRG_01930 [Coccidioides immitis RMSCC 2394]
MARTSQDQPLPSPSGPIEARSLLGFTNLASNPPNYPRNPTQQVLEPLVLYIVRVPGSKDVFLSPLKPPTKSSFSPESINASLYFCHVAGPGDEAVLENIENERKVEEEKRQWQHQQQEQLALHSGDNGNGNGNGKGKTDMFALLNRVRRKPVPTTTALHIDTMTPSSNPALANVDGTRSGDKESIGVERRLVANTEHLRGGVQSAGHLEAPRPWETPGISRHPVSSLSLSQEQHSVHPESGTEDTHAKRWSTHSLSPAPMKETFHRLRSSFDSSPGRASWDCERPTIHPKSPGKSRLGGRLHLPGESTGHPLSLRPKRSYEVHQETRISPPFHITLIRRDPTYGNQWNVGTITNCIAPSKAAPDGSVAIEITTPGYKKFANNKPISFESLGINLPSSMRHLVSASSDSSADQTRTDPDVPTGPLKFTRKLTPVHHHPPSEALDISPPRRKTHPFRPIENYAFTSPWNGTCTFGPGAYSRTLRCRHVIPGPNSSTSQSSSSSAVTVAEIRFNLPTFPSTYPRPSSSPRADSSNDLSSPFDEDRLDLSLARERAGGGMRGNSAKLGKLIIQDEGLKMVDLLVAASMGVFWGVYEHASSI